MNLLLAYKRWLLGGVIVLLVAAVLMLVAHVASRVLRQAMGFGPVAAMCAATAASFLTTASHLVPLVLLPYPLMDALNIMAPALTGVAEVFYVRSVFGKVRFGLAWSVALNLGFSVVLAVARHFELFELPRLVRKVLETRSTTNFSGATFCSSRSIVTGFPPAVSSPARCAETRRPSRRRQIFPVARA